MSCEHVSSLRSTVLPLARDLRLAWAVQALTVALAMLPTMIVIAGSNSYGTGSYVTNTSDALIFRSCIEILFDRDSPYDAEVRNRHIASTRLNGLDPPYDLPFAYPPNALPLFCLYDVGAPWLGYALFVGVGILVALMAASRLASVCCRRPFDYLMTVLAVGFCGPMLFSARLGQTASYLTACVIYFVLCYDRSPRLAGLALGLMAFKPQYALFMGLLPVLERRWRLLASAAATFAACTVFSGLLFGLGPWPEFFHAVTEPNHTINKMGNWIGLGCTFFPEATPHLQSIGLGVMLVGLILLAIFDYRARARGRPSLQCLAVAAAWVVIVSPNTHPYDLTLWLIPLYYLNHRDGHALWKPLAILGLCFPFMPRFVFPLISLALLALCLKRPEIKRAGVSPPIGAASLG